MPSKVYFTRNITPENVLKLYEACGLNSVAAMMTTVQ